MDPIIVEDNGIDAGRLLPETAWENVGAYSPDLFSIIILSAQEKYLKKCLASIEDKSIGANYEILIGYGGNPLPEIKLCGNGIYKTYRFPEWHYSIENNALAKDAKGEYLVFLNDDCEVITPNWLQKFLEDFNDAKTGLVGCKLLYPDDTIQHGGFKYDVDGERLAVAHRYRHEDRYMPQACVKEYVLGVTGACIAIRHELFNQVGGFNEAYRFLCQDTDLCIKVLAACSKIIYDGRIELYHTEGATIRDQYPQLFINEDSMLMNARLTRHILLNRLADMGRTRRQIAHVS